jgi:hypothetical protein
MFADVENLLGVYLRFAAKPHHFFIAGSLALLQQPGANPPDQRMKPKIASTIDHHVDRSKEVIVATDMAQLASNDCL